MQHWNMPRTSQTVISMYLIAIHRPASSTAQALFLPALAQQSFTLTGGQDICRF